MKNTNNFLEDISISKHGIHDMILELTYKLNFNGLFLGNLTIVFVALCVGLILFNNPTATYIAQKLSWVSHDAIMRLLPLLSINNNNFIILFIQAIQSQTASLGYLIIDDVIIRKPFGKSIFPTTYVYDNTNKKYVWGMHIVVLLWSNGWIRIPVAFRIWMPKEKSEVYHTKGELAINMINFVHKFGLAAEYVTFDTWYASKALLGVLKKYGYSYVCMIKNNRKVLYNNRHNLNVRTICLLHNKKQFRYYPGTGFYIKAITVILPGIGKVKLAIVKNGYNATLENTRFIITDMLDTPAQGIVKKYLCRWDIETFFRDIKQHLNFEKVQARDPKKLEGYFSAMFFSFIFIQILQIQNNLNTVGETVIFLQDFVQIKVNNVVYIINVTSKDLKSKQVND
ncbi:MAG: transposase, partial [Firmicutes bacterium]|nr:transposase [Bacillota bacterium]